MSKIALFDIETSPNLAYVWGKYEQDVIEYEEFWYILCFAYKWLDQKKVYTHALPDFKGFDKNKNDDKKVVEKLWKLFDEADILCAHNGDKFDIKKANARFAYHGFPPPSPYKTIDTCKLARKNFRFDSNSLNDLGKYLGLGEKEETGGFALWKSCMDGDRQAWRKMLKYNKQDVRLLEDVYLTLRSWETNHPNVNIFDEKTGSCPVCSSDKIQKRGFNYTKVSKRQRYHCQNCFAWSSGTTIKTEVVIR